MTKIAVTKSSGNVFADIGVPNAKDHYLKAQLIVALKKGMEELELNQTDAAKRTGINQGDLSKVLRGQFRGFSVEKLMAALTKLGLDVTIEVRKTKKRTGKVAVQLEPA